MLSPLLAESARCRHCGYLLRGLPERVCPECGGAFDPNNPDSYADPQRRLEWLRRERRQALRMFVAPPGVVTYFVLVWVWAWQFKPTYSLAAWHRLVDHQATPIVFALALLLLLWLPAGALIHRRLSPVMYPRWRGQGVRRWGIFALLLLSVVGLAQPWVAWARFQLSRAALEAEVSRALQTRNPPRFCRIGRLDVEYLHLNWPRGGVFVQAEHDEHDARYGFTWIPGAAGANSTSASARWALDRGPAKWHP
ncbi:MAG TPA: hypothetical protein PKC49_02255 [Phycisphaerae bacterium]|nr:hypothetical protein [Phycisphaerae bacterium]